MCALGVWAETGYIGELIPWQEAGGQGRGCMPSIGEMYDTCRRLAEELRQDGIDQHRLLEIETIIRLIVPQLTRAVAEVIHAGRAGELGDTGALLVRLRDHLTWIDGHREGVVSELRERLIESLQCASAVLEALERL